MSLFIEASVQARKIVEKSLAVKAGEEVTPCQDPVGNSPKNFLTRETPPFKTVTFGGGLDSHPAGG